MFWWENSSLPSKDIYLQKYAWIPLENAWLIDLNFLKSVNCGNHSLFMMEYTLISIMMVTFG